MQNYRITNKLPQAYRIIKITPQPATTPIRTMFSFPRFASAGEFAPLFRLLDDYASHQTSRCGGSDDLSNFSQLRSFQPRFDVKEVKDSYELHGELPGVEQKDIQIEFTDAQTLSIKGRSERHRESGSPPTTSAVAFEGQHQENGRITDSSSDTSSTHYQKPSVEDENTSTEHQQLTTSPTNDNQIQQQQQQQQPQPPQSHYWVSERSIEEFSRSFAFPSRVDQDNVKASLKDGILSIVVPKASVPVTRKIEIE